MGEHMGGRECKDMTSDWTGNSTVITTISVFVKLCKTWEGVAGWWRGGGGGGGGQM